MILWGGQSWLQPAFSRFLAACEDSRLPRKRRLKGGCRQDCPPHNAGHLLFLWLSLSCALLPANLAAQQPQNRSPMVERTRTHPRLTETQPPGRREQLDLGTLYLPKGWKPRIGAPLLIFFHGGAWIPEVAAAKVHLATVSVQAGSGSSG